MHSAQRTTWILLACLWACDDGDAPATGDAGGDLDARSAGDGSTLLDGGAGDGGADGSPDAEVLETYPLACPPVADGERMPHELAVEAPGSWWLEDCDQGWVRLRFTVPARTAWIVEASSGADQAPIVPTPGGENALDAPEEVTVEVFFETTHEPVVTIRWVECFGVDTCGADQFCAPATHRCVACADGDELFDTRMQSAPRTEATPRAVDAAGTRGVVCPGFDDWYVAQVPAGQPLVVSPERDVLGYAADPAAQRLADLVPIPFAAVNTPFLDAEQRIVQPAEVDRTIWLRVTSDATTRYSFDLPGCRSSFECRPWWHCEQGDVGTCQACDGPYDAYGDDNLRTSPDAAPIPLMVGDPLDGGVCGIDEDWYAVPLGDPGIRIELTGAIGAAYPSTALMDRGDDLLEALEGQALAVGSTIVLRSDTPEWYPEGQAPEIVWVHIGDPVSTLEEIGPTRSYTIQVEVGDFCAPDRGFDCSAGVCDAATGRCVVEEE